MRSLFLALALCSSAVAGFHLAPVPEEGATTQAFLRRQLNSAAFSNRATFIVGARDGNATLQALHPDGSTLLATVGDQYAL